MFQASVHENVILSLAMVMLYPVCICMCVLCHLNNKSLITASIFFQRYTFTRRHFHCDHELVADSHSDWL